VADLLGRDGQSWKLLGVMNIRWPRREHPYLQGVGGAEAVFRALLP
jgi:hypothetical protein